MGQTGSSQDEAPEPLNKLDGDVSAIREERGHRAATFELDGRGCTTGMSEANDSDERKGFAEGTTGNAGSL